MITELRYTDIYEQRILVFMETKPQSNEYNQVILTPKAFKGMTEAISRRTGKTLAPGIEETLIDTSKAKYKLPDLKSHE